MTALINALRENAPPPNPKDYPSVADQFPSLSSSAAINAYLAVFRKSTLINQFLSISKSNIENELKKRLAQPELIFQANTSLCGPAAFFYTLATKRPDLYARYVIDIAIYGKAAISIKGSRALIVNAPAQLLHSCSGISIVDWLTLATLINTDNPILGINCKPDVLNDFASITRPETLASWFRRIGCSEVVTKTQLIGTLGLNNLIEAQQRYTRKHSVCLLIHAQVLKNPPGPVAFYPNHWVSLTSDIKLDGHLLSTAAKRNAKVPAILKGLKFSVHTWGYNKLLQLKPELFLEYYHGFVSAKW